MDLEQPQQPEVDIFFGFNAAGAETALSVRYLQGILLEGLILQPELELKRWTS